MIKITNTARNKARQKRIRNVLHPPGPSGLPSGQHLPGQDADFMAFAVHGRPCVPDKATMRQIGKYFPCFYPTSQRIYTPHTNRRSTTCSSGWYTYMTESTRSPLARLVLFMVCLSVAGSIVAGVHYYAVDLPEQQSLQAPTNTYDCWDECNIQYDACMSSCWGITGCAAACYADYRHCLSKCDRHG